MKQFNLYITFEFRKICFKKKLHVFFTRVNQLELLLLYISYITTLVNHFFLSPFNIEAKVIFCKIKFPIRTGLTFVHKLWYKTL